ncbi:MAG: chorismate mutase [Clostridiaceae bacterium]|nr:chorismate mutase [Clostridiaceae bacterium]
MIALRGATTISCNCEEEIKKCSVELFDELIKRNNLKLDTILTIEFSCTRDITKSYPGKFIRENFDVKHASIMHFNEMYVEDNVEASIPLCIRILILADTNQESREFVYLNNARNLRKDLFSE